MSDVMLIGVLRMPYEMAMGSTLSQMQYHSRGLEAAERISADEARIEALERELFIAKKSLKFLRDECSKELAEKMAVCAELAEEQALCDRLYDGANLVWPTHRHLTLDEAIWAYLKARGL